MKTIAAALLVVLSISGLPALATSHDPAGRMSEGVVRKVDLDAQKITIRHGPLPQLDMPQPMTMVYRVKDPSFLGMVKAGDKIRFDAEKIGGAFTVTRIERGQ